jgi:hypothetical protein
MLVNLKTLHENAAETELRIGEALVNELIDSLTFQNTKAGPRAGPAG